MGPLLGHIAAALLGAARAREKARHWPLMLLALVLALLSVVFLSGAAFFALAAPLGPAAAAAVVAIALLLLAVIIMLGALATHRHRPASPVADPELVNAVLKQLAQRTGAPGNLPVMAIGSLLLGLAIGYSPTLRDYLKSFMEQAGD